MPDRPESLEVIEGGCPLGRGDVGTGSIGYWLKPEFKVTSDYEVVSVGTDAHGSYFVKGNEAVQRDLIASRILRD